MYKTPETGETACPTTNDEHFIKLVAQALNLALENYFGAHLDGASATGAVHTGSAANRAGNVSEGGAG